MWNSVRNNSAVLREDDLEIFAFFGGFVDFVVTSQ